MGWAPLPWAGVHLQEQMVRACLRRGRGLVGCRLGSGEAATPRPRVPVCPSGTPSLHGKAYFRGHKGNLIKPEHCDQQQVVPLELAPVLREIKTRSALRLQGPRHPALVGMERHPCNPGYCWNPLGGDDG